MNKREYRGRVADMVADLKAKAERRAPEAAVCFGDGLTVRNADDEAVLRIYDEISWFGITAMDVLGELDKVTAPAIRVELNSPGGDVFDGIAIHNALRAHPAHVTVSVDGIAASIASVIAQAGDTRVMQPASQMMIHNARGLVIGDKDDHRDMVDLLEQQDGIIAGIYAARSGGDVDEFRSLMNDETWLTDQGAVDLGLADSVASFGDPKPAATATTAPVASAGETSPSGDVPFHLIAAHANRRRR